MSSLSLPPVLSSINPIDAALIGAMLFSVLLGAMRGMLTEVLSLLGWLVAWYGAQWVGVHLAPHIPLGAPGSDLNHLGGFVMAFAAVLLSWGIMTWLLQKLMRASPLNAGDRALGALFGFFRGLVVVTVIVMMVSLSPLALAAEWKQSIGARWFRGAIAILTPVLPGDWADRVGKSAMR